MRQTAQSFSRLLDELELPAYVKTTGSRGLHVAVPLKRNEDFHSVRAFARCLAEIVVMANPEHRTLEQRKAKRRGRVFVDAGALHDAGGVLLRRTDPRPHTGVGEGVN